MDETVEALGRSLIFRRRDNAVVEELESALPDATRSELQSRRDELSRALSPTPAQEIVAVLHLFSRRIMPQRSNNVEEAKFFLRVDIEVLSDVPEWALKAAAMAFLKGEVGNPRFHPDAGELRTEVNRRVAPHKEELARIERILRACSPPPPPRDLIGPERGNRLERSIGASPRDMRRETRRPPAPLYRESHERLDPEEALAALAEKYKSSPVALSDRALKAAMTDCPA